MLKLDTFVRSDPGKVRTNNEDAFGAAVPRDPQPLNQSGHLYVVADGMGGHQAGEYASRFAVDTLLRAYYRQPQLPPEKRLREIFLEINQGLIDYTKENLQPGEHTGTTLLAAVLRGDKLWVANVGDSRMYLVREGGIRQITRDHTVVAELVRAGSMRKEEAAWSTQRNRLSRSIGIESRLDVDVFPSIPLRRGDILLLCSDGLTQYATSDILLAAAHGEAKEITEHLIKFANDCGGSDNITVYVIRVEAVADRYAGLSSSRYAVIAAGLVIFLAILLLAWIGFSLWQGSPPVPTGTATLMPTASSLPTDSLMTPSFLLTEQAAPPPGADLTGTPAVTISPTSSLPDCNFTVAEGNTTAGIAARFGATLDQVYRQDGTQDDMGAIRTGEVLVIKGVSVEACVNGGGVVPATATVTP
jgi:PPM family protein phosphatase